MATKRNWKISRKGNKILFILLGVSVVVAPSVTIIYSLVAKANYENKDPWSEAFELDKSLEQVISDKFQDDKIRFTVGEKSDTGIYVTENDISKIRTYLRSGEWVKELDDSVIHGMLFETGAKWIPPLNEGEEGHVLYSGKKVKNLALFPTILEYPYEGQNKYGEIFFKSSATYDGIFHYGVRLNLRLGVVDGRNKPFDLQKTYDYSLDHGPNIPFAEMLTLMNNESIKSFVADGGINKRSENDKVLSSLLRRYYDMTPSNMNLLDTINPVGGSIPSNEISESANAKTLHVKYDSQKINNLNNFGAGLFEKHTSEYKKIETIFNKIGISMPTFQNDPSGYRKSDRKGNFELPLNSGDINSYKGYVGQDFNDDISDKNGTIFRSEHNVFTNQVEVKFLNVNSERQGSLTRRPTNIYYDQTPYSRGTVSYDSYKIQTDINSVLEDIEFDSDTSTINYDLNQQNFNIKKNIEAAVKQSLNSLGVSEGVLKNVAVDKMLAASGPMKNYPRNGKDSSKVYVDNSFNFFPATTTVELYRYNKDGSILSGITDKITKNHNVSSVTKEDPVGKKKKNISEFQANMSANVDNLNSRNEWDTRTSEYTIISQVKNELMKELQNWIDNASKSEGYPIESNEYNSIEMKLVGPVKNGKLKPGDYKIKFSAPKSVLNFFGEMETTSFFIEAEPEPIPEPEE
ncbi:hypothetical protein [Spiroplasma endosymbiont of Othius punctulatus]|uniref:hypothetical protein n=1 Tax=Spiroplasma endosymbiont of Othius punctulatus TaxID=3066289 RepID=UPI0030CCFC47